MDAPRAAKCQDWFRPAQLKTQTPRQNAMNWFAPCGYSFLETALMIRAHDRAHLDTTTIGWMEPLTQTLSPLRGARELANRMVVVSRCAPHDRRLYIFLDK
jgi:hypothetical protein